MEAIAAVEGVDGLFFGPDDIKVSYGLPMDTPITVDPISACGKKVAAAARAAGKFAMVPCMGGAEPIRWAKAAGYQAIAIASDCGLMRNGIGPILETAKAACN